jgi:hypothetical protein
MTRGAGFLRDNAFLAGAIILPVVVALFFVAANAIPRLTVPDPAFDLVFKVSQPISREGSPVVPVEFAVRNGQVHVTFCRPAKDRYLQSWALLRFDHATRRVTELELAPPDGLSEGESLTVPVGPLQGVRVSSSDTAPDGYAILSRDAGAGGGIVGELFGMRRYRDGVALARTGRVIPLDLPASFRPLRREALAVGWVMSGSER